MKKSGKKAGILGALILVLVLLAGCGSDLSSKVAATYGDEEIYLDEVNFQLRTNQYYYESMYMSFYEAYYGGYIWDMQVDDYHTMEDAVKEDTMAAILQTHILMDHQEEFGVTLTDEDTAKIAESVKSFLETEPEVVIEASGATEELLTKIYTNNAIAMKVYQAMIADVNREVSDDDAAQFTVQTLLLREGEQADDAMTAEEKATTILGRVQEGVPMDEAAAEIDDTLASSTTSYGRNDTTNTTALYAAAAELSTGQSTTVYEDGSGWYVVYCVSDFDEEATENKKAEIISQREADAFAALYETYKEDAPEFDVNESAVESLSMREPLYEEPETEEEIIEE